ncbi:MAG TPA: diguanylate cyclase [Gammaproteobacteria bacterium]|jgi:diguanylate cyclase (GGDEF)-like protein|nr:diguanylate cyclase [Gammaproteobacteria bacterium]
MAKTWQFRLFSAPLSAALLTLLITGGFAAYIVHLEDVAFQARQRARVVQFAALARGRLEQQINLDLSALFAIEALTAMDREIDEAALQRIGPILARNLPDLREIQLSPGGVVRYVYPSSGEAQVRGMNLLELAGQKDVVRETIQDGRIRVAGPLALKQGGIGLVARDPIYREAAGGRRFWGFATLIVDYDRFTQNLQPLVDNPEMEFAVRGRDGLGEHGEPFFGPAAVFDDKPVTESVRLPFGSWQVAAHPRGGWQTSSPFRAGLLVLAVLAVLSLSVLAYVLSMRGKRIRHIAVTDLLTGALRRGAFLERASAERARSHRYGRRLCMLMLDIDHFKEVNDRHGHAIGDHALAAFAACVADTLRESDLFGRVGGEEFAVLCPETDLDQALALAERVRASVQELRLPDVDRALRITVSIGVVQDSQPAGPIERLLKAADRALYAAKAAGRNRVSPGG